jgi:YaiO family outer membrane protein
MTLTKLICSAALFASTASGAAAPASPGSTKGGIPGSSRIPALGPIATSVRLEYTDFSKLYGDRAVLTADSKLGVGKATRFSFSLSEGQRRGGETRARGSSGAFAVDHDWSDRLSTRTSAGVATNGAIFAKRLFSQDVSYKFGSGVVGTVGGKYANYGNGNGVATWSAGIAYYMRGATLSYRYSLLASERFGRSGAHLASLRLKDPGGSGSTQIWAGHGSSLYAVELPHSPNGRFTSLALQRSQPIGGGITFNVGANRAWYKTPAGAYRGTGLIAGLSFSRLPF